jgi:long-subunit acyl-CoA synthetase (AMP-forming)
MTNILNEIQCNAWITTQDRVDNSQGILDTTGNLKVLVIPSLEYFVRDESNPTPSYPYEKTWEQAKDDVVCIIHTSGTTGTPSLGSS